MAEQVTQSKSRLYYSLWRIVYTALVGWYSFLFLFPSHNELGREPGYVLILLGVLPSLLLLVLTWTNPREVGKTVQVYGLLIAIASLIVGAIAYGFLWLVVAVPLFTFIVEGFAFWAWSRYASHNREAARS
jgi:hypothetical protein